MEKLGFHSVLLRESSSRALNGVVCPWLLGRAIRGESGRALRIMTRKFRLRWNSMKSERMRCAGGVGGSELSCSTDSAENICSLYTHLKGIGENRLK